MAAKKRQSTPLFFIFGMSFFIYVLAMIVAKFDLNFSRRWLSFGLWIASVSIGPGFIVLNKMKAISFKKIFGKENLVPLGVIVFLSLFSRFLFLKTYPFVAVMDEIRDGGLNASQIISGLIKNIHDYGRYKAHGLIIPTVIAPFYLIFKNSVFSYRVPAALVSILDITIIYFLARWLVNKRAAFFAALILISLPIHLYYSRTQIVVIFSSLFTSLIIFLFFLLIENGTWENYFFLGLALGFASGYHASVRTVVFITLITISFLTAYRLFKEKDKTKMILASLLLAVSFFIGFGPRLLFTSPEIFLHAQRIPLFETTGSGLALFSKTQANKVLGATNQNLKALEKNYFDSLGVYFLNSPKFFSLNFQNMGPILTPPLALFFIFGIFYLIFLPKKAFTRYLLLFILLIPAANSALTDCLNCAHRLAPLLPISALTTAVGVNFLISKTGFLLRTHQKNPFPTFLLNSFLIILFVSRGFYFFTEELASRGKTFQDYLSIHTLYLLKASRSQEEICLSLSPKNHEFFKLLHIQEQHEYFLPTTKITKVAEPGISENEIYISKNCKWHSQADFALYECCHLKQKFLCPLENQEVIKIYIEKERLALPLKTESSLINNACSLTLNYLSSN